MKATPGGVPSSRTPTETRSGSEAGSYLRLIDSSLNPRLENNQEERRTIDFESLNPRLESNQEERSTIDLESLNPRLDSNQEEGYHRRRRDVLLAGR